MPTVYINKKELTVLKEGVELLKKQEGNEKKVRLVNVFLNKCSVAINKEKKINLPKKRWHY